MHHLCNPSDTHISYATPLIPHTLSPATTVQAKQEQLLAVEREQQEKMEKFRSKMLIERESLEMALHARSAAKEEVTIKEVCTALLLAHSSTIPCQYSSPSTSLSTQPLSAQPTYTHPFCTHINAVVTLSICPAMFTGREKAATCGARVCDSVTCQH